MKKYIFLTAVFLGATSFSTMTMAQDKPIVKPIVPIAPPIKPVVGSEDVAQLLYKVNKDLIRQEGTIGATHKALLAAHEYYVAHPNEHTYQALLGSARTDVTAVQDYNELVKKAQQVQQQIELAEKKYYGETPATKEELTEGGVLSEIPELAQKGGEARVESELHKELEKKTKGKDQSDFVTLLQKQATQLKSVQDRIQKDLDNPPEYLQQNTAARDEMKSLKDIIASAMNARRQALEEPINKSSEEPWEPVEKGHPLEPLNSPSKSLEPAHPLEPLPPKMKKPSSEKK